MGHFQFSIHMLKKEYQKSLVYTLTLCLTIAITFLFFNIIDNTYLLANEIGNQSYGQIPFSSTLSFIIIVFCAFMIIFANNFYISRKTKEIAIMTMSGSSFLQITMYLFYQNIIMTAIAFPLGIGIGSLLSMGVNQIIYQYMNMSAPFFYVPIKAIGDTIICILAIIGAQLLYASGFVYRKDIQYLLSQETRTQPVDDRIIKIPSLFYILLYFGGLIILVTTPYTPESAIFPCCVGVLGIGGMIKYYFGRFFKKLKDRKYLAHHLHLISLSNLYYSLTRAILLIGIYAVSVSAMIAILISQQNNPREFITTIVGFIVIVLLILASILYKYSMEASTRHMFYYNLYKLGYSFQQLLQIIKQEVISFYLVLVGLPMVYIVMTLIQAYIHNNIEMSFFIVIIFSQIIPAIIAGLLTYSTYKKSVLKVIEEGVHYE